MHGVSGNPGTSPESAEPDSQAGAAEDLRYLAMRQEWRTSPERAQLIKRGIGFVVTVSLTSAIFGGMMGVITYDESGEFIASTPVQTAFLYALIGLVIGALVAS